MGPDECDRSLDFGELSSANFAARVRELRAAGTHTARLLAFSISERKIVSRELMYEVIKKLIFSE